MSSADAEVVVFAVIMVLEVQVTMRFISISTMSKGWLTLKAGQETRLGKVMDWSRRVGLNQIPSRLQGGLFRSTAI